MSPAFRSSKLLPSPIKGTNRNVSLNVFDGNLDSACVFMSAYDPKQKRITEADRPAPTGVENTSPGLLT